MLVSKKARGFVCALAAILTGLTAASLRAQTDMPKAATPPINREHVDSTSIESIGFESRLKTLEVRFRSGATYRYAAVPKSVFSAFKKAESKGRFFSQQIRGQYEFVRITEATR